MTRPLTSSERQRLRTPANLWRALIPLLALIAVLAVFTWPRATRSDGVHVVDTAGPIAAARQQAGFTLLLPAGLDARWRPTSTEFVPAGTASKATLRIGYVSPGDQYAEFLEGNDAPAAVLATYGPLTADGTASVGSAAWTQYRTSSNRQLITRTVSRVTLIVTGSAKPDELTELAAALR